MLLSKKYYKSEKIGIWTGAMELDKYKMSQKDPTMLIEKTIFYLLLSFFVGSN